MPSRLESGSHLVPVGIDVYKAVFVEDNTEQVEEAATSRFLDSSLWQERASIGLLLVSFDDGIAAGFCLSYPKASRCWHIWLVGTLTNARRSGHWKAMLEATIHHAKQEGFEAVSIATIPRRFPAMFKSLQTKSFVVVVDEYPNKQQKVEDFQHDEKITLMLDISKPH